MSDEFIPKEYSICKPTDKRIDWNKIHFDKLDWDCVIRGLPWQVVRATYHPEGLPEKDKFPRSIGIHLNHCLGGRHGENNWYCYPLYRRINKDNIRDDPEYELFDEGPTPDNLIKYNGRSVNWSISFEETNYLRKGEMREGGRCTIWRNGKKFFEVGAREMNYGLASAQQIVMRLQEHPINFWSRKWKEELIGRKIWWNNDPCIVSSIIEDQGCVIIQADTKCIQFFRPSAWQIDASDVIDPFTHYNGGEDIKADYLDPHINWFRDEKGTELFLKFRDGSKNKFLDKLEELKDKMSEEAYLELHKVLFQGI
jgi:hypothetical protein